MKRMFPNTHCKRETGSQFVPVIAGNTPGGTIQCTTMQQGRLTRLSFQMYELCWCWFKAGLVKKASPYCSHFQGRSSAQILWWLITSCSLEKHFLHCVNNDTAFHLYDFSAIHLTEFALKHFWHCVQLELLTCTNSLEATYMRYFGKYFPPWIHL